MIEILTCIGPYEHANDWDPRSNTRIENLSSRDPSPVTEISTPERKKSHKAQLAQLSGGRATFKKVLGNVMTSSLGPLMRRSLTLTLYVTN